MCGSTVCEYLEKGRSRVRIFFQRLNDIWNLRKISEGHLTCQITLVKFIWQSDQLNGIYRASSEGHSDFFPTFSNSFMESKCENRPKHYVAQMTSNRAKSDKKAHKLKLKATQT